MMNDKYAEKAVVKEVNLVETPLLSKPCEGNIILVITNKASPIESYVLNCFVHGDNLGEKFKEGELISAKIVLKNWALKNKSAENKERNIRLLEGSTVVDGEIIDILHDSKYEDSFNAIVDCGIYVKLRILKSQNFKVGDYIQAEGRLDAYLVDKIQNGSRNED